MFFLEIPLRSLILRGWSPQMQCNHASCTMVLSAVADVWRSNRYDTHHMKTISISIRFFIDFEVIRPDVTRFRSAQPLMAFAFLIAGFLFWDALGHLHHEWYSSKLRISRIVARIRRFDIESLKWVCKDQWQTDERFRGNPKIQRFGFESLKRGTALTRRTLQLHIGVICFNPPPIPPVGLVATLPLLLSPRMPMRYSCAPFSLSVTCADHCHVDSLLHLPASGSKICIWVTIWKE